MLRSAYSIITLLLAGAALSAPSTHIAQRNTNSSLPCSETSFRHLSWTAQDLSFNSSITFTTPSHAVSGGYISFRLVNAALDYALACSASDTRMWEFFYGDRWFPCTATGADGAPTGAAEFRYTNRGETRYFATVQSEIEVRQRWTCTDRPYPITFNATGAANLTLGCTINKSQTTNWTMGQIYSTQDIRCASQDWTLAPTEISAAA